MEYAAGNPVWPFLVAPSSPKNEEKREGGPQSSPWLALLQRPCAPGSGLYSLVLVSRRLTGQLQESVQLKMTKKVLLEWVRVVLLPPGRPATGILTRQIELEARAAETCDRQT